METITLKPKLLEEPLVVAHLISPLKLDLGLTSGLTYQSSVSKDILVDDSFVQGDVYKIPGEREVIVVIKFHERLDLCLTSWQFSSCHSGCHFLGIVVNASQQSMAIEAV